MLLANSPRNSLPKAIEKLRPAAATRLFPCTKDELFLKMGYSANHGSANAMLMSLHSYGLIEEKEKLIALTPLGQRVLNNERNAVEEAAHVPELFNHLFRQSVIKSRQELIEQLKKLGWKKFSAESRISAFLETYRFVKEFQFSKDEMSTSIYTADGNVQLTYPEKMSKKDLLKWIAELHNKVEFTFADPS